MTFPVYAEKLDSDSLYYSKKMRNLQIAEEAYHRGSQQTSCYPVKLNAQTTDACNLRCITCPISRPLLNPHLMPHSVFESMASEVFPSLILFSPSDIGEPLTYPWFDVLCDRLKEYGVLLDLTTNGTLFTRDLAEKVLSVAADIKISYDGIHPETFENIRCGANKTDIDRILVDLIALREELSLPQNPEITLQTTILKRNVAEVPDIIEMGHDVGVDKVKAYYIISYHANTDCEVLAGADEAYVSYISEAHDRAKSLGISLEIAEYSRPSYKFPLKRVNCQTPWYQTWMDYDGRVYPCHSHTGIACGNISNSLFSVWNGTNYQNLRNSVVSDDVQSICHNCGMQYSQCGDSLSAPYDRNNFLSANSAHPIHDGQVRWSARTHLFDLEGTREFCI